MMLLVLALIFAIFWGFGVTTGLSPGGRDVHIFLGLAAAFLVAYFALLPRTDRDREIPPADQRRRSSLLRRNGPKRPAA
jgi:hypothetical protein